MRARIFWIALPVAVAVALWAGPGLGDEEMPQPKPEIFEPPGPTTPLPPPTTAEPTPPTTAPTPPIADPEPVFEEVEIECENLDDPGPDGDG